MQNAEIPVPRRPIQSAIRTQGLGSTGSAEIGVGTLGASVAYLTRDNDAPDTGNEIGSDQYKVGGYWRGAFEGFRARAQAAYSRLDFDARRLFTSSGGTNTITRPISSDNVREIGFLFIGGEHQMLHIAPVAAALADATNGRCAPRLFVGPAGDKRVLANLLGSLGMKADIERLRLPVPIERLAAAGNFNSSLKLPRLVWNLRTLRRLDGLVVAERTSTFLKRVPGYCPPLVHIPHGAGDRAIGFEKRVKLFDYVIAAGPKDRERMIEDSLVSAACCFVSGYVKLGAIRKLRAAENAPPLFGNGRPIVLYNPHFSKKLSSWWRFAPSVVRAVLEETDANLIVAPHVRMLETLRAENYAWLDGFNGEGRLLVDLGSPQSSDMTYTLAADIYVGDVSSQAYEFIHQPRPCVFLNATGRDQTNNRDFAHWRFGEVVSEPNKIGAAITRAASRHVEFAETQRTEALRALGGLEGSPAVRAAQIVGDIVSLKASRRSRSD